MSLVPSGAPLRRRLPAVALTAIALTVLAAGCGDSPAAPPASDLAPNATASHATTTTSGTNLFAIQGLLRTAPLPQTVVVVKTLSSGGGGISVPGTDFQLQVPNGAFSGKSMTFTITAYAGSVVAYDFQPHGVVFLKPLKAVQQLGHTNWKSYNLPAGYYPGLLGGYFADASQINFTTGLAYVNEFESTGVNVGGATMTWDIPHFSGYIVASGRQ